MTESKIEVVLLWKVLFSLCVLGGICFLVSVVDIVSNIAVIIWCVSQSEVI